MATHFAVTIDHACCNNVAPHMWIVVTIDGLWDISGSFLVTWHYMKCDISAINRDVILHDHVQIKYRACIFV